QGYGRQINQPGRGFLRQVTVQLLPQVGQHLVLWFDPAGLRGAGCSLCGYDRSQPALRRLFPAQFVHVLLSPSQGTWGTERSMKGVALSTIWSWCWTMRTNSPPNAAAC